MNKLSEVTIGNVKVGDGNPTVFVAEIGTFFNQDITLAKEYLQTIATTGAQIFKTEILHDPDVCLNTDLIHRYEHYSGFEEENYRRLIERKCVPLSDYSELFKECQRLGIPYIATVYDLVGVDFLVDSGASAIKIARDNVNNIPLIRYSAKTGLPVIFDAGQVYLDEIALAVRTAQASGSGGVIVNHHPGSNPAPAASHNMRTITKYKETFGIPVGLSCHYKGDEILYVAIGLGANLLEKGVVEDPSIIEQDLISAAALSEVPEIVQKVRNCWEAIGSPHETPLEPRDLSVRKGLIAAKHINKGDLITLDHLRFAWPPVGISVQYIDIVEGSRAGQDIHPNEPLTWHAIRF
ncbi:MAG: spore coat protein [Chloroflexi bacterium]|nr:spore coat protein [Chloroflexota bacterium]|tara:strand:- start:4036 stop:5088 length:1053 start_codon:yes stop_codon:yes gene_type:complete